MNRITADQLNQVAALLNTTDKNVVISAVMKTLTESGVELPVAFDSVFGEGSYRRMAGDVYQAIRAKA